MAFLISLVASALGCGSAAESDKSTKFNGGSDDCLALSGRTRLIGIPATEGDARWTLP